MGTHWTGATVPGAGDDLLAAWPRMLDTVGVIVRAQSITAARQMLTAQVGQGLAVSTDKPVYFDVNGVLYRADGTKGGGQYVLRIVSESQMVKDSPSAWTTHTLASDQRKQMVTSSLPAAPYPRHVKATWIMNATVSAGVGYAYVEMPGDKGFADIRRDTHGATATAVAVGRVEAGVAPQISAGVVGASGVGATVGVNGNSAFNKLIVEAYPASAAS